MMKNHCHAWSPRTSSIFVKMPAAKNPDKIFDMVFPACQIAMRMGFSSLVYQEDVTVARQLQVFN